MEFLQSYEGRGIDVEVELALQLGKQLDEQYGASTVVRPEWVIGTGIFRIPRLGYVRVQPSQLWHTSVSMPVGDVQRRRRADQIGR
ncbi:hypothetical protein C9J85_13770 [Haloferax sp. wsp5]|nr:hypothetical protein C9J85_13770 [Haloferax sp. wsp5]